MAEQKTLFQIIKFAVVGAINTDVDLSVLNMLMFITGIACGFYFSAFKALSFAVAVLNSYFMNKYWAFAVKDKKKGERIFSIFHNKCWRDYPECGCRLICRERSSQYFKYFTSDLSQCGSFKWNILWIDLEFFRV